MKQGASACLQVMGAHLGSLRGRENEQRRWREALEVLQSVKELSEEQRLSTSLCISYGALTDAQACMFLDAAFFFLGRRADTMVHAWQGCGWTLSLPSGVRTACFKCQSHIQAGS